MEKSMSRMLVETVVKKALKSIKESPERGIRNLVDMALQFSEGRFQKNFFTVTQTMLQNENSAYYGLVRDVVAYTDSDRLFTFGMNLGYNGCTEGARRIRENEVKLGCNIPWTVMLQIDAQQFEENQQEYNAMIREGESLGIYTWMLFPTEHPQEVFSLVKDYPDSAFCIFCEAKDITSAFIEEAAECKNLMLVIRYDENADDICSAVRERGLLYSVWYQYSQKDTEIIINGDLFSSTQQLSPTFTVLLPEKSCPEEVRRLVYQEVKRARSEQNFRTLTWELQRDNLLIDSIISGDGCSICFDKNGNLYDWSGKIENYNLFQNDLAEMLTAAYLKKVGESV